MTVLSDFKLVGQAGAKFDSPYVWFSKRLTIYNNKHKNTHSVILSPPLETPLVPDTFWCSKIIWSINTSLGKSILSSVVFDKRVTIHFSKMFMSHPQSHGQINSLNVQPLDRWLQYQSSIYLFSSWPSASLLLIWHRVKLSLCGRFGAAWFRRGNFLLFFRNVLPRYLCVTSSGPWLTFSLSAGCIPASLYSQTDGLVSLLSKDPQNYLQRLIAAVSGSGIQRGVFFIVNFFLASSACIWDVHTSFWFHLRVMASYHGSAWLTQDVSAHFH